jgi:mono/diheme cytochrome c family protein
MRRVALVLAGLALVGAAAGCGAEGTTRALPQTVVGTIPTSAATPPLPPSPAGKLTGNPTVGTAIFKTNCGACHTLAAAGTTGTVGPNLDQAHPTYQIATSRIWFGGGAMPPFGKSGQLKPQQVADVAAYVVKSTGGSPPGSTGP